MVFRSSAFHGTMDSGSRQDKPRDHIRLGGWCPWQRIVWVCSVHSMLHAMDRFFRLLYRGSSNDPASGCGRGAHVAPAPRGGRVEPPGAWTGYKPTPESHCKLSSSVVNRNSVLLQNPHLRGTGDWTNTSDHNPMSPGAWLSANGIALGVKENTTAALHPQVRTG
jgi:hypothetical protein